MTIIKDLNILNDELTLIDLYADWCGPCKMLSPILEEINDEGIIKIYKINVDESIDIARKYNVDSIPTLLLFKNKTLIDKHIGYSSYDDIVSWIKEYK